ncbi:MAG: ectoine/hydroxyectoine ABC transporter substrate-binding protein EhuB [Trueperaceae bacterium]
MHTNLTRPLAIIGLALALVLSGAAFGQNTLQRAQDEGTVTLGLANEVPYAYRDADTGELTGEAIEVARAVFHELGIENVEGVVVEFGSLIPGLQAGRFDVVTAGMYITPARCEQVAFANPEYSIGEGIIVPAGNPMGITSYADIAADSQVRVGTGAGWVEYDYLLDSGVAESQIVTFPDAPTGVGGLTADRIDVFAGTSLTMRNVAENDDAVDFVEDFQQPVIDGKEIRSYGAAAFRPADSDFRDAFNEVLAELNESGQLAEIIGEFGFGATEHPGAMTAAGLCN